MATKKLGNLIKKARTDAGLTQEELAKKVRGLTAADIGKAEKLCWKISYSVSMLHFRLY